MPFYKEFYTNDIHILLWKFSEEDNFDIEEFSNDEKWKNIQNSSERKKYEFLMVRYLLKKIAPYHKILYKADGTPFLSPQDWEISISHSFPFAIIALSDKKIGIDIEPIRTKIYNVKHRFLSPNEKEWHLNKENEIEIVTIIWSIKESLYKLHQMKHWSFSKHYEVEQFSLSDTSSIHCRVYDEENSERYIAQCFKVDSFWIALVY